MRFLLMAFLLVSGFVFAGDAEKPVAPVQMILKGSDAFATIHIDIADLQKARKIGAPDAKGTLVKMSDEEFKIAVARRVAEQVTQSYNVMIQTDADLEKRGKEAKARVDHDLEDAKRSRPDVKIED